MDTTYASRLDELKTKHRAMWGLGDYAKVADTVIPNLGRILVEACGITPEHRVLDVAAGTGNATLPAARTGATITAADLSDTLLEECGRRASTAGLAVDCVPADVESLPFGDGAFDVVLSCVGAMFAPDHQKVADELHRVCRVGGTIAMANWTPDGFIGQMFGVMKAFAPPPPAGSQPPPLWGDEDHIRSLFGSGVGDLTASRLGYPVTAFPSGAHFRDFFKANYGPTIAVYRSLASEPDRAVELDAALAELYDRYLGEPTQTWGYLLVTCRKT